MSSSTLARDNANAASRKGHHTAFQQSLLRASARGACWLLSAWAATGRHGVAGFYSRPLRPARGWSHAEVAASAEALRALLRQGMAAGDHVCFDRALELAHWLAGAQLPDGAFPGGEMRGSQTPQRAVWETGLAIEALLAASGVSQDARLLESAAQAGRWLSRTLNPVARSWTRCTHLRNATPAFYTRVCSALLSLWQQTQDIAVRHTALTVLHHLADQRDETGGFRTWAANPKDRASMDCVASLVSGFWHAGRALDTAGVRFTELAQDLAMRLATLQQQLGRLPGSVDESWEVDAGWTSTSGTAQMVTVWLDLFEQRNQPHLLNAALFAMGDLLDLYQGEAMDEACIGGMPSASPLHAGPAPLRFSASATSHFVLAALRSHESLERILENGLCASS